MGDLVLTQPDLLFIIKEEPVEDMVINDSLGCGNHEINDGCSGS